MSRTGGDEQMASDCAAEALLCAKSWAILRIIRILLGGLGVRPGTPPTKCREKKEYARRNVSLDGLSEGIAAPFFARVKDFLEELWTDEPGDDEIERMKREIVDSLNPDNRELIELAYEKKLPLAEMAERLGKSKDAARVKLSRVIDRVTNMARACFETDQNE